MYFMIWLEENDPDDYNGIESYVHEEIKLKEIVWLPII
jgi:hypothetical protein